MFCGCPRSFHAALVESDRLLVQRRFGEALSVATRALSSRSPNTDLSARFRIVRAHSLWGNGRAAIATGEARRAASECREPLTRARAQDAMALFAWKDAQFDDALALAESARRVYEASAMKNGLARSLHAEAGLLADRGQLEPALRAHGSRVEALRHADPERLAEALADRSTLFSLLGRWGEARADLEAAVRVLRHLPLPGTLGLKRAVLALQAGELADARRLLGEARETERLRPSGPRVLAEGCLVGSDVLLATGLAAEADAEATAAVRLFVQMADRGGECRARVRRAQALLALGRLPESIRESRRALVDAARAGTGFEAVAELTLGHALLRGRPAAALEAFDRALECAQGRPDLSHAARLGRALACCRESPTGAIEESLLALERWGDRRLLELARAEVQRLDKPVRRARQIAVVLPDAGQDPPRAALVEAAVAWAEEGDWAERFGRGMLAIGAVFPFQRAVLVSEKGPSLEVRLGLPAPCAVAEDDVARSLARRTESPALFELDPGARDDHGTVSRVAAIVPVGKGAWLYVERRGGEDRPGADLAFVCTLSRLLGAHLVGAQPAIEEEAPRIPGLVGRSGPMQVLAAQILSVAAGEETVHIFGETGTGKERVARAIHDHSPRCAKPFVALNGATLSDEFLESQLFGHVRGAFTGAVADRDGLVVAAEGGTLFLDEVAELTPKIQAMLLRFVQEREYRKMGETRLRHGNVRVLTATNVSLVDRVAAGRFREDLYYRLAVFTVELPPLRERGEDVLLLARHFLRVAAEKGSKTPPRLPEDVAGLLRAYRWPGNVRELDNEMRKLVHFAHGRVARPADLSPRIAGAGPRLAGAHALSEVRMAFERDHVSAALRRSEGNRTRAAADLGITRQALHDKLRRLGLEGAFKRS